MAFRQHGLDAVERLDFRYGDKGDVGRITSVAGAGGVEAGADVRKAHAPICQKEKSGRKARSFRHPILEGSEFHRDTEVPHGFEAVVADAAREGRAAEVVGEAETHGCVSRVVVVRVAEGHGGGAHAVGQDSTPARAEGVGVFVVDVEASAREGAAQVDGVGVAVARVGLIFVADADREVTKANLDADSDVFGTGVTAVRQEQTEVAGLILIQDRVATGGPSPRACSATLSMPMPS